MFLLPLANSDPTAKILGDRFATVDQSDSSTYRFMEEIMKDQEQVECSIIIIQMLTECLYT